MKPIKTHLVDLTDIKSNPFLARNDFDPEAMDQLIRSILQEGLLQPPLGRRKKGETTVELAYGHRRVEAFRRLSSDKPKRDRATGLNEYAPEDYLSIAVEVRSPTKLPDVKLFELAVRENLEREDVSAIDEAKAMHTYMETFDAPSTQVGELWNMDPGSVRNKIRLLRLPEQIQARVHGGMLSQNRALSLLAISRKSEEAADTLAGEIFKSKDLPADQIDNLVVSVMGQQLRELAGRWHDEQVEAKYWKLGQRFLIPWIKAVDPFKFYKEAAKPHKPEDLKPRQWTDVLKAVHEKIGDGVTENEVIRLDLVEGAPVEVVEAMYHLHRPPICKVCPLHSIGHGTHFCEFEACFKYKKAIYIEGQFQAARKKVGLPWLERYNKRKQGDIEAGPVAPVYGNEKKAQIAILKKAVKKENRRLKLKVTSSPGWRHDPFTDNAFASLVLVVDPDKVVKKAKPKPKPEDEGDSWEVRQMLYQIAREQTQYLLDAAAPAVAESLFKKVKDFRTAIALTRMAMRDNVPDVSFDGDVLFEGDDPELSAAKRVAVMQKAWAFWMLQSYVIHQIDHGDLNLDSVKKLILEFGKDYTIEIDEAVIDEQIARFVNEAEAGREKEDAE